MSLGYRQEEFALAEAKLTIYAYDNGYKIRKKHLLRCFDCKVGKKDSVHKDSLACDWVVVILDIDNNKIISANDDDYNFLHDKWDKLGGAPRIKGDLGHFSFSFNGRW